MLLRDIELFLSAELAYLSEERAYDLEHKHTSWSVHARFQDLPIQFVKVEHFQRYEQAILMPL